MCVFFFIPIFLLVDHVEHTKKQETAQLLLMAIEARHGGAGRALSTCVSRRPYTESVYWFTIPRPAKKKKNDKDSKK